jgi:hypothetical protein
MVWIIGLISFFLDLPSDRFSHLSISQDLGQLENRYGLGGWRGKNHLVECKLVTGGWDFLIGIIRHPPTA